MVFSPPNMSEYEDLKDWTPTRPQCTCRAFVPECPACRAWNRARQKVRGTTPVRRGLNQYGRTHIKRVVIEEVQRLITTKMPIAQIARRMKLTESRVRYCKQLILISEEEYVEHAD